MKQKLSSEIPNSSKSPLRKGKRRGISTTLQKNQKPTIPKTKKLVIVESPAKARTLSKMLGRGYTIKASVGHVRDLPKSKLGVNVENYFEPHYIIPKEKKTIVRELGKLAETATTVYLATDPDREGEAISWHLVEAIHLDKVLIQRVVFHSITEDAVKEAFLHPREIDMYLVDAQQTRRILDRLVGYKLSPLLWRKVARRLSAGRVQSVALRLIVERERIIQSFVSEEYWTIEAELSKDSELFKAKLIGLATERKKLSISTQDKAESISQELGNSTYIVSRVSEKEAHRQPTPPFITSTLQQEAWRKLGFTAQRTMAIAQQLYEGLSVGDEGTTGLITYMRTDSTQVAETAVRDARDYIREKFGGEFLPHSPRHFTKKAAMAQEAHEAIRPTKMSREPSQILPYLTKDQVKLYDLIWKRMIASQMAAAIFHNTTVDIEAATPVNERTYLLRATGIVLKFSGFLALYQEGREEEESEEEKGTLPPLKEKDRLALKRVIPLQHFTQPPPRYNEASLIKMLEEKGIGRPSTYAPIISTLQQRGYVQRKEGRLHPLEIGLVVNDLLVKHFNDIVNVEFTAQMEERLDQIARGDMERVKVIQDFYTPFKDTLDKAEGEIEKVIVPDQFAGEDCSLCGRPMVIKRGRYGQFIACSGYPECKNTKPLPGKPRRKWKQSTPSSL